MVRPWQIKRIIGRLRRLGLGHDLDHDTPLRKFTVLDRAKQGLLVPFADPSHDLACFAIGEMGGPCIVLKWNLTQTQTRSPAPFQKE